MQSLARKGTVATSVWCLEIGALVVAQSFGRIIVDQTGFHRKIWAWDERRGQVVRFATVSFWMISMIKKCIYCFIYTLYIIIYIYVYYSYICNRKYANNIVLIYLYSVNETKDINFFELQSSVRAMMLSCAGVSKQGQGHWVQLVSGIILGGEDIHGYRKNPGKQHGIWKG